MSHFTHSIKKHCMVVVVFLSSCFPRLRKSRAVGFLAGTFKRARATVIKRQDRKWGADYNVSNPFLYGLTTNEV